MNVLAGNTKLTFNTQIFFDTSIEFCKLTNMHAIFHLSKKTENEKERRLL